jgi:iron complex transport system permease protein
MGDLQGNRIIVSLMERSFYKELVLICVLIVLLSTGAYMGVALGSWEILPSHVSKALLSKFGLFSNEVDPVEISIVWDGRMPRLLVAFLVGFSLAASGCIMQGVFKNPMASPGVIGISSGAALGAVAAIYLGLSARFLLALPVMAVVTALLSLIIVFAIATSGGKTSVSTLLLAGIALNLVFGALTSFIITLGTREFDVGRVIVVWLMGDLNNRSWEHVLIVLPTTLAALAGTYCFVKDLNILMIDEETAVNLGVNVRTARNSLLFFSSLQTGGAIAVSGVIGFVGLIAPHIVRGIIGPDNRKLIPVAGLLGAVLVIYADLFVRLVIKMDLKVGILTSLMGGPFFIYLLIKYRKRFEYL